MPKERECTSLGTYVSDEYQTPTEWVERFAKILGGIGLDPCYSDVPNYRFEPFAKVTWGVKDDALSKSVEEWNSHDSIYMNCCYSAPAPWAAKLAACDEAPWIALCNTQSSAKWWHELAAASTALAFPTRRICFIDPVTGKVAKGNRYDQTIFIAVERDELTRVDSVLGSCCQIFERVVP